MLRCKNMRSKMAKDQNGKINWPLSALHFFFGAILGAGLGFMVWGRLMKVCHLSGIACVGIGALIVGLLAGLYGEDFWDNLRGGN